MESDLAQERRQAHALLEEEEITPETAEAIDRARADGGDLVAGGLDPRAIDRDRTAVRNRREAYRWRSAGLSVFTFPLTIWGKSAILLPRSS